MNAIESRQSWLKLKRQVRHVGCTLERCDSERSLVAWEIVAPAGHYFQCSGEGVHGLILTWCRGLADERREAATDAMERLAHGIERCPCEDCQCE